MGQCSRRGYERRNCECRSLPIGYVGSTSSRSILCSALDWPSSLALLQPPLATWHLLMLTCSNRVKTRLQVQGKAKDAVSQEEAEGSTHYKSTADAIRKIVADEGYVGLFSGLPSALIGVASTNFAYFYWYSVVRASYLSSALSSSLQSKAPSAVTELALGAAAGALAQILTIPVSVVTTRQQTQARGAKKGLLDTGREVVNGEDGWTGLWRGLNASLVLVVNPAITYGAYERLREAVFPGKRNLRPWEAFSKMMAAFSFLSADQI